MPDVLIDDGRGEKLLTAFTVHEVDEESREGDSHEAGVLVFGRLSADEVDHEKQILKIALMKNSSFRNTAH